MKLTIGWLYPDLMSFYGDRGNIICLTKRCQWRGIKVNVNELSIKNRASEVEKCDFLFMGGAQDRQQKIAAKDLREEKGQVIKEMIEDLVPGLFVCGAYQFMGRFYRPAEGKEIPGLGIFDLYTVHPGKDKQRCIGNIIVKLSTPITQLEKFCTSGKNHLRGVPHCGTPRIVEGLLRISPRGSPFGHPRGGLGQKVQNFSQLLNYSIATIVGFENHGGRTYLGKKVKPLGDVIKGFGNNGEDDTEGCVYKNAIGTYLHGPILPKNPHLADYLIKLALEKKYQTEIKLEPLDDSLEWQAHDAILAKFKIKS